MGVPSFLRDLSIGTSLALRLEGHLSWLQTELRQIELTGTTSEQAALQATINDVRRLRHRFVC
jgi:hypothetical protein